MITLKQFDLTGKTALVTGGGRGIGRSIALGLAAAGANVAVTSRTEQQLKEVTCEIEAMSRKGYYSALDIRDQSSVKEFVKEVVEKEEKIDILVNAAGDNRRSPLLEVTEEDWQYIIDLNLKSVLFTTQAVIPYMQKLQYGKIINIASLTSVLGFKEMGTYAASKGGVSQLTKTMAVEFAEDGITANAIGPGYFKTNMTKSVFEDATRVEWMKSRIPMGRTGELAELQGAAVYLASDASKYVTGQTIYVDGGWLSY